jgi:predicted protein tyrosine phosphatase
MQPTLSLLTVCGLEELDQHSARGVTHVLSILDPGTPEPEFGAYGEHRRTVLRFHDIIVPLPDQVLPEREDVEAILGFHDELLAEERGHAETHVLIHCHAGISRSTAAMAMLLAKAYPDEDEIELIKRLHAIREKAWPNARMIAFADDILGRGGRLTKAVRRLHARQLIVRPNLGEFMRNLGRSDEVDAALTETAL